MWSRRSFNSFTGSGIGLALLSTSCTGGQIDPAVVLADLKVACGIAVPIATVTAVINAAVGATVSGIVDVICSGFHSALAAQQAAGHLGTAPMKAGTEVDFVVSVNGKIIPVHATVQ